MKLDPMPYRKLIGLSLLAFASCSDHNGRTPRESKVAELIAMTDLNPSPDIVEVALVAGVAETSYLETGPAQVWAYRDGSKTDAKGSVPGPLIRAKQGDQVIVRFRNELLESTTVHWHGLRVPNAADGTPSTQVEVPPGGEYRYEFTARDAGTFWYHPHVRGDVQIERGLQGMVIIDGGPTITATAERSFVFDDVKLNGSGTLSDSTTPLDIMLGRLGNFLLANGTVGGTLPVISGARERWRIVNTANGRYLNLRLPGHQFRVIGWDGGLLSTPYTTETLLIVPGERYEVLVELHGAVGGELPLQTVYYDRGHDIPDVGPETIMTLHFESETVAQSGPVESLTVPPISLEAAATTVTRSLKLGERMINDGADVLFTINDSAYPDIPVIGAIAGDIEVWSLQNDSEMDHPFHVHGMFFRILDTNGVAPEHVGWKDTVNVPKKSTLRFVVQYGEAGRWMYHCHILEHAERGMMGELKLSAATAPVP